MGYKELNDLSLTPLTIEFQSICTTDINGEIFKLKRKEDDPLKVSFNDRLLLLKVNANKSDLIHIRLSWTEVTLLYPYYLSLTRKDEFDRTVNEYYLLGLDLRVSERTCEATYCLTKTSSLDCGLKECVLRGIPIISEKWLKFALENLNNTKYWLLDVGDELLFPSEYSRPNKARSELLQDKTIILCYNASSMLDLQAHLSWVRALLPNEIYEVNFEEPDAKSKLIEMVRSAKNQVYLFQINTSIPEMASSTIGKVCNTMDDLWGSVVAVDRSKLHKTSILDIDHDHQLKREAPTEESGRLAQRKRRRKIERVSETDFFLFSLSAAPTQIQPSSPPLSTITSLTGPYQTERAVEADNQNLQEKDTEKLLATSDSQKRVETQDKEKLGLSSSPSKAEQFDISKSLVFRESEEHDDRSNFGNGNQFQSRLRDVAAAATRATNGVSLTEAIISTKHKAEEGIKNEFYEGDPIEEGIENLVIVEEIELFRPQKRIQAASANPQYIGRKNFKAFRKAGVTPRNVTRTFIQLYDENSAPPNKKSIAELSVSYRHAADFAEMGNVSGYQPEESQNLFVAEESENERDDDRFAFTHVQNGHDNNVSEDESDGEIRFKFST